METHDIVSVIILFITSSLDYLSALQTSLEGTLLMSIGKMTLQLFVVFIIVQILQVLVLLLFTPTGAVPYSRRKDGGKKILILGDSTAVGTGALSPEFTIAGRIAIDFPKADILNLGVNGTRTRGVLAQLELVKDQSFDLIIISTGGNDVWAFTSFWRLKKTLRTIFSLANTLSNNNVIILFFGNNGSATFVPLLFRGAFLKRTEKIQALFKKITEEEKVPLVELFTTDSNNPFIETPKTYFAEDGMHPSDLGYWIWYKKMWEIIREKKLPILQALHE